MTSEVLYNDKALRWTEGLWTLEPDYVEWVDGTGLACIARRHSHLGTWCAYVAVGPDNALYGSNLFDQRVPQLRVHGGVTFAGPLFITGPEYLGKWFFGFHCNNKPLDLAPIDATTADTPEIRIRYRDLEFVQDQCTRLAVQLVRYEGLIR